MPRVYFPSDPFDAGNPRLFLLDVLFSTPPQVVRAWHESEHTVVVEFDLPVKQTNELEADDALNPANWSTASLSGVTIPRLLRVEAVYVGRIRYFDQVRLRYAAPEARHFDYATITASSAIMDYAGVNHIKASSVTVEGDAEPLRPYTDQSERAGGFNDLAMREFSNDSGTATGGTLEMTTGGDYGLSPTVETVRKLVHRVLTTVMGEFAHLPTFGSFAGSKTLGTTAAIQRVVASAKRGIMDIPAVEDCVIAASLAAGGVFTVTARVKVRHLGETVVSWEPRQPGGN